ncbi:MAG: amidohydrolase family protein [Phycisphaerales bacterium]|nr:amidohydrolase family protein [Phycisphaerales bacterium]
MLAKNGVISAIGTHVPLPPDCEVVDAAGRFVYPGLIAPGTSGIFGSGDPRDTTDLFGLNMTIALAGGITAVLSGNDVAKLTFGTTDGLLVKRNVYWNLNYSTRNPIQRAELRAGLERVRNYLREVQRHEREKERNPEVKAPDRTWLRGEFEQYRRLLARETIAVATANDSQALRDLATLARQYDFALVIRGAAEGWLVAPELSRAGARVILTPRDDRPPDLRFNRPTGSTIENARILSDHGVLFGILPGTSTITLWGLAGRDLLHLNMEAAFAVRGGLPNEDALRSLTIDAARILGVDDRLGSLEVGKDADLIITDGDILHYMTQVHIAVVHGRVAYRKADETLFAHIRPQGERTLPEFDDQWPRRLEWPQE